MNPKSWLTRTNLLILGRLALFLGTIGVLGWLSNIEPGRRYFVEPVTRVSVFASHHLINLFGGDSTREGTLLLGPTMTLDVKDGCNGVVAMILFTGAVVAHETGALSKLTGLALGLPAIWIFNLVRIITLYFISVIAPARLEFFHLYFWQTLIIIFVVAIWNLWALRTLGPPPQTAPPPPAPGT